jgi:hypothetical protein
MTIATWVNVLITSEERETEKVSLLSMKAARDLRPLTLTIVRKVVILCLGY